MQKYIKCFAGGVLAAAALASAPVSASAQSLQSGYFDDNYLYRFQMNPAMGNGKNFVSFPGLGNLDLGVSGTLGLKHIFCNYNGRTTTILNPNITTSEALDGWKNHNRLGFDVRETIMAVGFKALGGYNTVSISTRANVNIGLPKDIVRLAKGVTNTTYDLTPLGANARSWAEIGLNHSRDIMPGLRVGASLKFLLGIAAIDAKVNTANLHLNEDQYIGEVDAEVNASVKGMRWETSYDHNTDRRYVDGAKCDDFSPINGFGLALDLGAVYKLNSDWEFSLAFTDLGFISWSENQLATTNGVQSVETSTLTFNVDNNDSWDKFRDNLANLYELEDAGDTGGRTTGIGATMNVGAKYTFPLYRRLNFGLMNTTRINGDYSWTDFRLSANVRPVDCFSAGINVGMGTFGASFGWILDLNVTGFNLFVASDCLPGKLAKQGIPLTSNANINVGINFPF